MELISSDSMRTRKATALFLLIQREQEEQLLQAQDLLLQIIGLVIFALGMVLKFGFEKVKPYLDDALNIVKASGNLGAPTLSDSDLKEIDELVEIAESILKDVAIALIIVGSVMLVIVLLGCCGACYKINIFLFLNSVNIFILLVAMVTVAGLYLNKREIIDDKVKQILKTTIKDSYKGLKDVNFISLAWNFAMQQGCYDVLWSYVEKYNNIVMTVVILMALIEAVIIFLGCWRACKEGEDKVSPSA